MPTDAKAYALKLLSLRDRSESELRERLLAKGFTEESVFSAIENLKNAGFIDDSKTAGALMRYCEQTKLLGAYGCRQYMRRRGIPEEIVGSSVFSPETEIEKAKKLVEKKERYLKNYPIQVKLKRLYGMLARKGFDGGIISEVLRPYK